MAAKEGRELVKEAVKDAKALKAAALEAAKNEIVEQMAPGVKALLEKQIRSALAGESVDRVSDQGADYYSPASREKQKKYQEGKHKGDEEMADEKDDKEKELDLESLAGFFPQLSEDGEEHMEMPGQEGEDENPESAAGAHEHGVEEGEHLECPKCGHEMEAGGDEDKMEDEGMGGMSIPHLGEDAEAEPDMKEGKDKEKDEMEEEVEISETELHKVYEAALQTEAQVSKGFKDIVGGGELDQAHKETGIADKKTGEKHWETEVPPDHVDYQIKEALKAGLAENNMLRAKLKEAVTLIKRLGQTLHETNLFNSKVLHVNRILNSSVRLTKEQKQVVLESIDKAKSVAQVKMVYEAIVSSFKASAGQLSESKSRKPVGNAQRARTSGAPKPEILRESVDRAEGQGKYDRMRQLAGLLK
jgi:hypothetical protein